MIKNNRVPNYKLGGSYEIDSTRSGFRGCEINVSISRDITADEKEYLNNLANDILDKLKENDAIRSPAVADMALETKEQLLGCFNGYDIYVEELPNGYWPSHADYAAQRLGSPWFKITTRIGHFVIGWRKAFIQIDWNQTKATISGDNLVDGKICTTGPKMIRTDSLEEARKYIRQIIESVG